MKYVDPVTGIEEEEISWGSEEESNLDGLLGIDLSSLDHGPRSGLWALIGSSLVSHPSARALERHFDKAPGLFTSSLRQLAHDTLDVTLQSVSCIRFRDIEVIQNAASAHGVIKSESLDNPFLISADSVFIHTIVDYLLGGSRGTPPPEEARRLTSIEIALISRIFRALCQDLTSAFQGVVDKPFILDKVETKTKFTVIAPDLAVCALATFRVDIAGARGFINILLPFSVLDPVRDRLEREIFHSGNKQTAHWREALSQRVKTTAIDVVCVLADKKMTLGEISELSVGDVLHLDTKLETPVMLRSGTRDLAAARIGRAGDTIAVQLLHPVRGSDRQGDKQL